MKAAAWLLVLPALLGGCGVFAPEARLDYSAPLSATTSFQDAYNYTEDAKARLYSVGNDNSVAQTVISYGTYVATLTGAGMVAFSASSTALKAVGLGAGTIIGLDYVASPRARRAITDQGVAAVSCLETIALGMDALPQGFGAAPASVIAAGQNATTNPAAPPTPRSPVSVALGSGVIPFTWRRVPPAPVAEGAPPPIPGAPVPVANTSPTAAANSMREYANALLQGAGLQAPPPRLPGAPAAPSPPVPRVPPQVAAIAAGRVLQAADTQEAAMVAAASSAQATSASAPRFLARNTENVLNLVVRLLHGADHAASDIETQTRAAVTNALKDFQGAASNAATQSSTAKQTLSTTTALTGSAGTTAAPTLGPLDSPPSGLPGEEFPPLPAAQGPSGANGGAAANGAGGGNPAGRSTGRGRSRIVRRNLGL